VGLFQGVLVVSTGIGRYFHRERAHYTAGVLICDVSTGKQAFLQNIAEMQGVSEQ